MRHFLDLSWFMQIVGKVVAALLVWCALGIFGVSVLVAGDFDEKGGLYVELGGRANPDTIGGSVGLFGNISKQITLRGGVSFLGSESFDNVFGGGELGLRFSLGKRFSPFIGGGIFVGYSEEEVSAENDGQDNDHDEMVDEVGETKEIVDDIIASVYPEVGAYFWLTDTTRIDFSTRYHVTTEGREQDFWLYRVGFSFSFK